MTVPPATTSGGGTERRRRIIHWLRTHVGLVALVVIPFVVLGLPLLVGQVFLDGDNFLQNLPMRVLVGWDLRHGALPLWNPYLFSGTPLLGGFNAGAAYPATWLTAVLPTLTAWTLALAASYGIAVVGMYLFLRRLAISSTAATFGAATFAFAGYMTAQIPHVDLIEGAGWLPWMLLAVHALTEHPASGAGSPDHRATRHRLRPWMALLAFSAGMSILSGGVESTIDSGVVVLVYAISRLITLGYFGRGQRGTLVRPVVALTVGAIGGAALGAAQWVPGLIFASQSQRAAHTYSFFTFGSLPARLVTLLVSPFALGTNQDQPTFRGAYNFPEVTSYMGILALIAACSLFLRRWRTRPEARHWWVWYVVMVLGLLSALGGDTPFGHLLYLIPGLNSQRLLNRNLLLVDVALSVLLAWWAHLLLETRAAAAGPRASLRSRWRSGGRAELIVTCIPFAAIATLCVLAWVAEPTLGRLLREHYPPSAGDRLRVAGLMTAGTLIAGATTWVVLAEGRFSARRLRHLLAAILAVDLILFNWFVVRPPISKTAALAQGSLSTAFTSLVGDGRFIVYDPDEYDTAQLYELGQTDLNIYHRLPSAQGYTALTDGNYFNATGAHYQEAFDPTTLADPTWDGLNVTTLLSLPSYFLTPIPSSRAGGITPSSDGSTAFPSEPLSHTASALGGPTTFDLRPGQARRWYFGGVLTVRRWAVPIEGGAPVDLRVGLIGPTGADRWLPSAEPVVMGSGDHRTLEVTLPTAVPAGGVIVEPTTDPATVGVPTAVTSETGAVALNGRMQLGVVPPHWIFTGMLGPFGVFHNSDARGWAWIRSAGGGPVGPANRVSTAAPDDGGGQRVTVHTTSAAVLDRSESWTTGWHATIQQVLPGGSGHGLGPSRAATVEQNGVIQTVRLPGPGDFIVTFDYAPNAARVAVAISAASALLLVLGVAIELVGVLRRRRG